MKSTNVSEARRRLPAIAAEVATTGVPMVITRRGRPLVKLVPVEAAGAAAEAELPLRGLPLEMSADFDEPLDDLWHETSAE